MPKFLKHTKKSQSRTDATNESTPPRTEPRHIALVQAYFRANLHRHVSLAELAKLTGLSKGYLIRSFHRIVGAPPYKWFLQLKIEVAEARLLRGDRIRDVAMDLGFADQSHFHRKFKRLVGMTPTTSAEGHYRSRQKK